MSAALVTGAGRGLGLEVARRLAQAGIPVALGVRDPRAVPAALAALGTVYELDVADPASVARCAAALADDGVDVDVLVNSAAVADARGPLAVPEADMGTTMATNLYGPWLLCRALVPGMVGRGYGRVVNVSCAGLHAPPPGVGGGTAAAGGVAGRAGGAPAAGRGAAPAGRHGVFGVSKAALEAFTLALAAEVAGTGDVKVNAVAVAAGEHGLADGATDVVWAATLPADGPSGVCLGPAGPARPVPHPPAGRPAGRPGAR